MMWPAVTVRRWAFVAQYPLCHRLFTLFSWGGALYLADGRSVRAAIGLGGLWGVAGMAVVALLLYALPKLAHTGTLDIATAVGTVGSVYIDIPEGGEGEIRTEVGGVMSHAAPRRTGRLSRLALRLWSNGWCSEIGSRCVPLKARAANPVREADNDVRHDV